MWARLDDNFPDHQKVLAAGPMAGWLYVCGNCYCNRLLTDGFIPIGKVRSLADVPDALVLADKLVEVGLWERGEGGYFVHDFLDYNPSSDEVKQRRDELSQKRAEAGRKGMENRWHSDNKITNDITNGITNGITNELQDDSKTITPHPLPSHTQSLTHPEINPPTPQPGGESASGDNVIDFSEKVDNRSLLVDDFIEAYPPDKDGRQPARATVKKALARFPLRDSEKLLLAARNYALSSNATSGYVMGVGRFVRDEWEKFLEAPTKPKSNGAIASHLALVDQPKPELTEEARAKIREMDARLGITRQPQPKPQPQNTS